MLNVGDWALLCTERSPLVANALRRDGTSPTNDGVAAAKAVATPRSSIGKLAMQSGKRMWAVVRPSIQLATIELERPLEVGVPSSSPSL